MTSPLRALVKTVMEIVPAAIVAQARDELVGVQVVLGEVVTVTAEPE